MNKKIIFGIVLIMFVVIISQTGETNPNQNSNLVKSGEKATTDEVVENLPTDALQNVSILATEDSAEGAVEESVSTLVVSNSAQTSGADLEEVKLEPNPDLSSSSPTVLLNSSSADTVETATQEQISTSLSNVTPAEDFTWFKVLSVVDGDTLKINYNGESTTLRLIGMDTPETVDPRKPVQCFGREASNQAKKLLTGQKVRIEFDPTQGEIDKYGRALVYLWLENGELYNLKMIKEGYAHEYTYNLPYKYQTEFKQAVKEA